MKLMAQVELVASRNVPKSQTPAKPRGSLWGVEVGSALFYLNSWLLKTNKAIHMRFAAFESSKNNLSNDVLTFPNNTIIS